MGNTQSGPQGVNQLTHTPHPTGSNNCPLPALNDARTTDTRITDINGARLRPLLADPHDKVDAQPDSRLLSLPPEIRLGLYRFMDLPPMPGNGESVGFFFSCRQIKQEMQHEALKEFQSVHDNIALVAHRIPRAFLLDNAEAVCRDLSLSVALPEPQFLGNRELNEILVLLYALPLSRLHIRFGKAVYTAPGFFRRRQDPEYLLKLATRDYFDDCMHRGKVNCQTVIFTLESLAEKSGGRVRSTTLYNIAKPENIPYSLTIVETKENEQSERIFSSLSRFKPKVGNSGGTG